MNRSSFALFVALLIHLLFVLLFILLGVLSPEIDKKEKPKEHRIKVSLKELPKKHKRLGEIKKKPKPTPIAPPMPKGKQLKKLIKKPPILYKPKKIKQQKKVRKIPINQPKIQPKPKPKPKVMPIPPKKAYIPIKTKPKRKYQQQRYKKIITLKQEDNITKPIKIKNSKFAWAYQDKASDDVKKKKKRVLNNSSINQNIKELYGDKFGKLSPGQQKYIIDNQEIMRRITQEVLTRVARVNLPRNLNVNKTNIIEFYLHPNGDMSDFRFIKKSGYYVLDDTTKETIEYAYSRYPRPTEKTLIRYNVFYNLARY